MLVYFTIALITGLIPLRKFNCSRNWNSSGIVLEHQELFFYVHVLEYMLWN